MHHRLATHRQHPLLVPLPLPRQFNELTCQVTQAGES
jgi:hypothetical protein